MPFDYAHTRKPCYQYSWDWAPFMNTLGVWKDVYVEMFDQLKIDYAWIRVQSIKNELAILNFAIKLDAASAEHDF
jgi:beta-mannosidase